MDTPPTRQSEPTVELIAAAPTLPPISPLMESTLPTPSVGPREFEIPIQKRELWTTSFVARYGDFQSWDHLEWSRQLPKIAAQLRSAEATIFNRDTGEVLQRRALKSSPGSQHDEHEVAFGHLALMGTHGEAMGLCLSGIYEELAPYWRFPMLHSVAPETEAICRWFSGGESEKAPHPIMGNLSAKVCLEAIRTQFYSFFRTRGEFEEDRRIWHRVIYRIGGSLTECVDVSDKDSRERLDRANRELLLMTYQDDRRFRGTLAAKVGHDNILSPKQSAHEEDWDEGVQSHRERAHNRYGMLRCMISAVYRCEMRSCPDGPHHGAVMFLQRVQSSINPRERLGVPPVLEWALANLQ